MEKVMDDTKECAECGVERPLSDFLRNGNSRLCVPCLEKAGEIVRCKKCDRPSRASHVQLLPYLCGRCQGNRSYRPKPKTTILCPDCGSPREVYVGHLKRVNTGGPCELCKKKKQYRAKRASMGKIPAGYYIVVESISDFRKGAEFDATNVLETARGGCWPDGIIFQRTEKKDGKVEYLECYTTKRTGQKSLFSNGDEPQRLVAIEG